jgi:hypothetical protein
MRSCGVDGLGHSLECIARPELEPRLLLMRLADDRHPLREPFLNLTFVSNGAEGAGGPLVFMPNILYVASSQRTDAVARLTLSNSPTQS